MEPKIEQKEQKEPEKEENTNKFGRFRRGYNIKTNDIIEKKEEEKPIESPTKFTRKRFFNNNIQEKVEEPEIKNEPKEEKKPFKRSYYGKFRKGKSTLDEETPKKIIEKIEEKEEKPQRRFKKFNLDVKEEPINKNEKKEEVAIEPKKNNTYFGRYSRRLLESKKEKEKEKERDRNKEEENIEKEEEKPKTLSRYDRFSYKPKIKNQWDEKDNNNNFEKEKVTEKITTTTFKSKYSPYTGKSSTTTTTTTTVTSNDGKNTFMRKRYHYTGNTQEEPKEEPKDETKVETKKESTGFRRYRFGIKK